MRPADPPFEKKIYLDSLPYIQHKLISVYVCIAVVYPFSKLGSLRSEIDEEGKGMWNWLPSRPKHPSPIAPTAHMLFKCHIPLHSLWRKADMFFFACGKNKTLERGWVCDCLLSFFISLCKHCCVGGVSLFLDARVNFSFMPRFPETHTKSDILTAHSQTVRAEQWRHLWWNKLKSLWCCVSLWALQGRPPTASPTKLEMAPAHLPYS